MEFHLGLHCTPKYLFTSIQNKKGLYFVNMLSIYIYLLFQTLNPLNIKGTEEHIQISNLKARKPVDHDSMALKEKPDKKFYVAFDFYMINNYHFHDKLYYPISTVDKSQHIYMPQINHISNILPHAPPLTQLEDLKKVIYSKDLTEFSCFIEFIKRAGEKR